MRYPKKLREFWEFFLVIGGLSIGNFIIEFSIVFGSVYISLGTYMELVNGIANDYTAIGMVMLGLGTLFKIAFQYDQYTNLKKNK